MTIFNMCVNIVLIHLFLGSHVQNIGQYVEKLFRYRY